MEQECKVLRVEKDLVHKPTSEGISNASAERQRRLNFRDRLISSVEVDFVRLVMQFSQGFLLWCRVVSELKHAERETSDNDMEGMSRKVNFSLLFGMTSESCRYYH